MVRVLTVSRSLFAFATIALLAGCSAFSDPAVRLARCLDSAVSDAVPSTERIQASCDLKLNGSYVVVLHPSGDVPDEELVAAGLPEAALRELHALRISDNESIYVIATGADVQGTGAQRSVLSSRTTSHKQFVKIPKLFVQTKSTPPVDVEIGGPATAREIRAIH